LIEAEMKSAGVWSMMVPRAYGGMEASLTTWMRTVVELGRGDAGVAWGVTLNSATCWVAAGLYPRAVADGLFAKQEPRFAGVFSGRVIDAAPVEDGLLIKKATWFFNSGAYQAEWNLLGVPLFGKDGAPMGPGIAIVPMSDVNLLDDWNPSGLRGSGSTNCAMAGVTIPHERIIPLIPCVLGAQPLAFPDSPLYRLAFGPLMVLVLAFPVLGAGKHMLEAFIDTVAKRDIKLTIYGKQAEATVTHLQIGEASAKISAAEALLEQSCRAMDGYAQRGEPMPKLERAAITRDSSFANKLVWEAVDLLASAAGGSWTWRDNDMNRVWQDAKVGTMHPIINLASNLETFGKMQLGLEPDVMPLI
jgi:3-hydroxy-9,10-secoandrosta-1,3,5(10)-triene-9,17-dione monooxygenase